MVIPSLSAALLIALALDAAAHPRGARSAWGRGLLFLAIATAFGLFLTLTGAPPLAAALAVAGMALLVNASKAKQSALGEPLLFSDLALLGEVIRHPRFYFSAVPGPQKVIAAVAGGLLTLLVIHLSTSSLRPHLWGAAILLIAGVALAGLLRTAIRAQLAPAPDAEGDVARHGLVATLFLYWRRWRATPDPPAHAVPATSPSAPDSDLVLVVQCESFTDPVALTGIEDCALPGLSRARARADLWGQLAVDGFGAYTMRTEYGVLFGRSNAELGFRRYDPFLTAGGEGSYALPARLAARGYEAIFAHPHSLRFYRRDRLMPTIGFSRLLGEGDLPSKGPAERYLPDRAFGASLAALANQAKGPTFVYGVTMGNHGPWLPGRPPGSSGGLPAYLAQLRESDAMLDDLIAWLDASGRRAMLVFFGDHRPSIPGATDPSGPRYTPYVMLHFPPRDAVPMRMDLSPDQLHHVIWQAANA